ncbi:hypothetical protein ACP2W0_18525 [Pseudobacillus badius]|uniref:hypothetical protein n=1 Tax=Bacillus badius TaxID=1455 RepID=UPI003CFB595C
MALKVNFLFLLSITLGFFVLAFISSESKLSSYFIFGCSIFVVFFSAAELIKQNLENNKSLTWKINSFLMAAFYILSIPFSVLIGYSLWLP